MLDNFKDLISQSQGDLSEDDILESIRLRVAEMMDTDIELLLSYMYRLDVLEVDIQQAMKLNPAQNMPMVFAQLIWNRQKKRIETRKKYKQDPIEDWEY